MPIYYGRHRDTYVLKDKPLDSGGGEGVIYELEGNLNLVAKLYRDKKFAPLPNGEDSRRYLYEKLLTMLDQPVNPYVGSGANQALTVAWPQDILMDSRGAFVGYTMPRVSSRFHIYAASRERERKQLYPNYTWKTAVIIASNLALAVKIVHGTNAVIGDFNTNNIMLDDRGRVTLIDTDSFNITNQRTGKVYKCTVGVAETLPPELQGKNLAASASVFTQQTDNFALAIHIFSLLMNNCHPFLCNSMNQLQSSASGNPVARNIVQGNCPYVSKGRGIPNVAAPDITMLPPELRQLFERAFAYDAHTAIQAATIARRPSAEEWFHALQRLLQTNFATCGNPSHVYPPHNRMCPWCAIEQRRQSQITIDPAPMPAPPPAAVTPPVTRPPANAGYGSVRNSPSGYGGAGTQFHSSPGYGRSASGMGRPPVGGPAPAARRRPRAMPRRRDKKIHILAIFAILVALAVGAYMALENHLRGQYAQGEALLAAGNYREAIAAFEELGSYSDAEERTIDAMYQEAKALMAAGSYAEAAAAFEKISTYSDAEACVLDAKYQAAGALLAAGDRPAAAMAFGALGTYQDAQARSFAIWDEIAVRETISAGNVHAAGLKSDGTVVTAGRNSDGQCDVESWTDIIAVSTSAFHTVGLKSDGTVVVVGRNSYGEYNAEAWTDIVAVAASNSDIVGLKSDGTVVVAGYNQSKIGSWTNIVAISAGGNNIVGLEADGSVVTMSGSLKEEWTDITAISVNNYMLGLKANGTVMVAKWGSYWSLEPESWTDIVAVSVGGDHSVGLKSDGTVEAVGYGAGKELEEWTNIMAVSAGTHYTLGLKPDGTVVADSKGKNRPDVSGWSGIKVPDR